jgi:hypothetical protein
MNNMDNMFKPGDFVSHRDDVYGRPRLVVSVGIYNTQYSCWDESSSVQVSLMLDNRLQTPNPQSYYYKIQETKELIEQAKQTSIILNKNKQIDNLTYIEICARLREYERSI